MKKLEFDVHPEYCFVFLSEKVGKIAIFGEIGAVFEVDEEISGSTAVCLAFRRVR